jgi:hypothetical protein
VRLFHRAADEAEQACENPFEAARIGQLPTVTSLLMKAKSFAKADCAARRTAQISHDTHFGLKNYQRIRAWMLSGIKQGRDRHTDLPLFFIVGCRGNQILEQRFPMNKDRMHPIRACLIFRLTLTNSLIHLPGERSPKLSKAAKINL